MSTFQINKEASHALRSLLMSEPFNAKEKKIQYGIQYTLDCGVNCNAYHSDKKPSTLKVNIQNKEANKELADLLDFHISTMAIQEPM